MAGRIQAMVLLRQPLAFRGPLSLHSMYHRVWWSMWGFSPRLLFYEIVDVVAFLPDFRTALAWRGGLTHPRADLFALARSQTRSLLQMTDACCVNRADLVSVGSIADVLSMWRGRFLLKQVCFSIFVIMSRFIVYCSSFVPS